ncbi:unnamed protein product, partial [Prorocentrum cordatum]
VWHDHHRGVQGGAAGEKFHIDDEHVAAAFASLDTNHEEIHYSEFLAAMVSSRIQVHDDLLKQTFKRFDTHNHGYITKDDLRQVLGQVYEGEERSAREGGLTHPTTARSTTTRVHPLHQGGRPGAPPRGRGEAHKHPDNAHRAPRMKPIMDTMKALGSHVHVPHAPHLPETGKKSGGGKCCALM